MTGGGRGVASAQGSAAWPNFSCFVLYEGPSGPTRKVVNCLWSSIFLRSANGWGFKVDIPAFRDLQVFKVSLSLSGTSATARMWGPVTPFPVTASRVQLSPANRSQEPGRRTKVPGTAEDQENERQP